MHRFSWVVAAALALAALLTPASASADPKIQSVTLTNSGLPGEPLGIDVRAIDPSAPVTGVDVRFPGASRGFSESSCSLKPNGKPDEEHGYGPDKTSSFKVPWVPTVTGLLPVTVQVTSGGCGLATKHARKQVKLSVGLGDLPAFPVKGNHKAKGLAQVAALNLKPCDNAYLLPNGRNGRKLRGAMQCLINVLRSSKGLTTLKGNAKLRRAALSHTKDMLARSYFDHTGPAGGPSFIDRLQGVGYWPATAGENIAYGGGVLGTPYAIFLAWTNSDGHRENMLNPKVHELGTGVAVGAPDDPTGGATYTTDFGIRY
jgi:uncharacterized protein YkwD